MNQNTQVAMRVRSYPLFLLLLSVAGGTATGQTLPTEHYWVYVANESSDLVSRIRFGSDGLVEEKTIPVGVMPADIDGAHGVTIDPSGRHWFVSLAHGTPFGRVWKFTTGTDRLVDTATVGLFPATMAVSPDGLLLFAVNFNLHGDPAPSTVSVLYTPMLQEIKRIETCVRPHGGKVNAAGTRYYSVCVGSDQLVEISTTELEVTRRMGLAGGVEGPLASGAVIGGPPCNPTWVAVTPDDQTLFVPCNGRDEVLEIDAAALTVRHRYETGRGPYNADVSPDGRVLAVTLKGDQAIALIDVAARSQRRIGSSEPITHGVIISSDSRYAFVTNEAIGGVRGTVDVFDLNAHVRVGTVRIQHQPGGIGFWRKGSRAAGDAH